jgi:hypothetical protein
MRNTLGLVELLLVLLGAMGWGAYELWSLHRQRKQKGGPKGGGDV